MRATIRFNLPEESEDHKLALKSGKLRSVITEFDNWLRNLSKYENKTTVEIQEVREKLWAFIEDEDARDCF